MHSETSKFKQSVLTIVSLCSFFYWHEQGCSGLGTRLNGVTTPFCTSNVAWRCGIQTIALKHGCHQTDVLLTRRFALLVKSLQWNRKIQCGNSC